MEKRHLDYFYSEAAEQFTFYRIPKILFTDPYYREISADAKILYGLLLDRMSLSLKNQWVDEQNRVYIIFSIDEVMEMMGCGNQKAVKILAELDGDKGIGLIEKKRQGLGRPNLIYIKNFLSQSSGKPEKIQKCENHTSGNVISGQAYQKTEKEKCEFHTSGTVKTGNQKVWVSQANDTEWNKTDMKKTVSIHPPFLSGRPPDPAENYRACEALIRKKIDYPALVLDAPEVRGKIDEIVAVMTETCCTGCPTIRIGKEDRPSGVVRSRILSLTAEHIRYVLECLRKNTTSVHNIRQYLLTVLYHAPETMCHYYAARVNHDLYGAKEREEARSDKV
jgi:hypothetical protein